MDSVSQLTLLRKLAPVLRFDERELFTPCDALVFARASTLVTEGEVTAEPGTSKEGVVNDNGRGNTYLQFVNEADRVAVVGEEAKRFARNFLGNRLGRVGIFGRLLDALFQLSVFFRRTTPRLTTAAAAIKAKSLGLDSDRVVFGRVITAPGWIVLHYAYFYAMNDWRTSYRGLNDHEGDWEQAWIFCDPETHEPVWIAASNHDYSGGDLRRRWDDPEVLKVGDRPVLFAGAGSHALYFRAGDYVTRLNVTGLGWLLRLQRWARGILRIPDEAAEQGLGPALGVPFVDSATGDGVEIRDWDVRLLDEVGPWVDTYRGLWGLDTHDQAGGERGPGGPKFGREGMVRSSWYDPVGFVGLHGQPSPSHSSDVGLISSIDAEIFGIDREIEEISRALPLSHMAKDNSRIQVDSEAMSGLLRNRSQLNDLRDRLELGHHAPDDLRSHISKPAVPVPPPRESGWILSIWAAFSVPLLLLTVASVFLFTELHVQVSVLGDQYVFNGRMLTFSLVVMVLGFYLIEQLARRRLQAAMRLLLLYLFLAVAFVLLQIILYGVFQISLFLIGGAIAVFALFLLIINMGEIGKVNKRSREASDVDKPQGSHASLPVEN